MQSQVRGICCTVGVGLECVSRAGEGEHPPHPLEAVALTPHIPQMRLCGRKREDLGKLGWGWERVLTWA